MASESCKSGLDRCHISAVKAFKQYYTSGAGETAADLATDFCKSGGDASCIIEQYNTHANSHSNALQAITMASEACKQSGLEICNGESAKIFKQYWTAEGTANMVRTFCKEGGDHDCLNNQYRYHRKQTNEKGSILFASEVCKNGGLDPCRGNAVKVFKQYYGQDSTVDMANEFCRDDGDSDCLVNEYNGFSRISGLQERVKAAALVCKTGHNTNARHNVVNVFTQYYTTGPTEDLMDSFFRDHGDPNCIVEQYNEQRRTPGYSSKEAIDVAREMCSD